MPLMASFVGGAVPMRSGTVDAERCVNLYPATVPSDGNAKKRALLGTPGLCVLGSVSRNGCRGRLTQDGRTFAVVGDGLYEETFGPYSATYRGAIVDDGQPVSMASNGDGGTQLAIVGGGQLKVLALGTNVLSAPIALPLTNAPVQIGFLDSYFVLLEKDSLRVWFSAPENGTSWGGADFFARSTASDRLVAMLITLTRVWIFGSETSEAYEFTGAALTPFEPIKGSLFPIGCGARWSVAGDDDTIFWLGASSRGNAIVYRLAGYGGQAVSSTAIGTTLGDAPRLDDAEGIAFAQDGHRFYALTVPSAGEAGVTWVYDATESEWHQRSAWNQDLGIESMWRVRGHACVNGLHVVGSRDSGTVWALDPATYDDDGGILRAVRRAPYLSDENGWAFLDQVEVGVQMGVGLATGQGSAPLIEFALSRDAAQTWPIRRLLTLGAQGRYTDRAVTTRLGRARLDRLVFETVITDPVIRVISGLWIRATPGNSGAWAQ